jgi:hypothetical protein
LGSLLLQLSIITFGPGARGDRFPLSLALLVVKIFIEPTLFFITVKIHINLLVESYRPSKLLTNPVVCKKKP